MSSSLEFSIINGFEKVIAKRVRPKVRSHESPTPAPAHSDVFSQLEKQVAEIMDGTIRDVLEELTRLRPSTGGLMNRLIQAKPSIG